MLNALAEPEKTGDRNPPQRLISTPLPSEENNLITLEEIKSDPAFEACFPSYMPSDDRIRHKLNETGIMAAGKRIVQRRNIHNRPGDKPGRKGLQDAKQSRRMGASAEFFGSRPAIFHAVERQGDHLE